MNLRIQIPEHLNSILVAAMVKHSIPNILTFNVQDFRRYSQIKAFDPADILAGQLPSSA